MDELQSILKRALNIISEIEFSNDKQHIRELYIELKGTGEGIAQKTSALNDAYRHIYYDQLKVSIADRIPDEAFTSISKHIKHWKTFPYSLDERENIAALVKDEVLSRIPYAKLHKRGNEFSWRAGQYPGDGATWPLVKIEYKCSDEAND